MGRKSKQVGGARNLAHELYQGQVLSNGKPYIEHIDSVAKIMETWHAPSHIKAAAYLHDSLKENRRNKKTLKEVKSMISSNTSEEALSLVEAYTKLEHLGSVLTDVPKAVHKKLSLYHEAATIRIACRLSVAREIKELPKNKRAELAESLNRLYIPYCYQLGMLRTGRELQDIAFKELEPKGYSIASTLLQRIDEDLEVIEEIRDNLSQLINIPNTDITFFTLNHLEAYKYFLRSGQAYNQITLGDLVKFVILPKTEQECYSVEDKLDRSYKYLEKQDFILDPKPNGYKGIITRYIYKGSYVDTISVIIRTKAMHRISVFGYTGAWQNYFKKHASKNEVPKSKVGNSKRAITRDGEIKYLPKNATVLDFAYYIHGEIGNRCETIFVNGEKTPFNHPFEDGDIIDVIAVSEPRIPHPDWLNLAWVKTDRAKQKIKNSRKNFSDVSLYICSLNTKGAIEEISRTIAGFEISIASFYATVIDNYGVFLIRIKNLTLGEKEWLLKNLIALSFVIEVQEDNLNRFDVTEIIRESLGETRIRSELPILQTKLTTKQQLLFDILYKKLNKTVPYKLLISQVYKLDQSILEEDGYEDHRVKFFRIVDRLRQILIIEQYEIITERREGLRMIKVD